MSSSGENGVHKVCRSCGTELPEDARFCPACGTSQTARLCENCAAELPADAQFCMNCGTPCGAIRPATSRRVTSVLFADLVGFTALAEGRDHEDVRELLTRYYSRTQTVVARYGGTLEKFIGDAVMAVWGVPVAHEDDAERAVRAGLEIIDAVAHVRDELAVPSLDVRVGVVTDEVTVTAGATGQGLVTGDAVNTASRVQSVAEPGQVWVDETTRLLTHAAITYADTGSHRLKGKQDPIALWSAQAVVANVGGGQRADGLEAPLTGRNRELRLIKELFHRTEESRQPAMLVISSDAGLGKTRLGWEFSKYADGLSSSVRWLEGRCAAYGDSIAFYALAEAIRGRLWSLRSPGDSEPETLAELLERGLALYVDDAEERDWIRPRLAVLLLDSEQAFDQQDLFRAWIGFLTALAKDSSSVVLLIDDAEHADEGFLAFLTEALRTDDLALFVLLLSRHELVERHPHLATNSRTTIMNLSPLSPTEMSGLVDGLVRGLPDGVRDGLVQRSDGVPLFAMETVRSMIDRDMVLPRGGQYVLASADVDLEQIGAPASLHALVVSRLDALGAIQRSVVDSASVLGQGFTQQLLAALHPDPHVDLDTALEQLVRRQILTRDANPLGADFGRYGFVQDAVRQIAYRMLARRDRRTAHLRIADHLRDGPSELASLVARHLMCAAEAVPTAPDVPELRQEARDLLVTTALRTLRRGTATGAIDQLKTAMALSDSAVQRARIESVLARAFGTERDFAAQERAASSALASLTTEGEPASTAMAAAHLAFAYIQTGRVNQAITILTPRWEDMLAADGTEEAQCLVGRYLLLALHHAGRYDEIMSIALPTMRAAEHTGDDLAVLRIVEIMAYTTKVMRLPRLTTALVTLLEETSMERGLDTTDVSAKCTRAIHLMWHDLEAARLQIDAVDDHIERHRLASLRGWLTLEHMLIYLAAGRWSALDAAYEGFEELIEPLERGSYDYVGLRVAMARGQVPRLPSGTAPVDDDAPPGQLLLEALNAVRSAGADGHERANAFVIQAARRSLSIHASEGLLLFADCLELAAMTCSAATLRSLLATLPHDDSDLTVEISARAHRAHARALVARLEGDDPTEIEAHLREAISAYDSWGGHLWARRCEAELATLLLETDQSTEAELLLASVRSLYQDIGASDWLSQLDEPQPLRGGAQ